ncbi:MAG: ATP-binding protein [Eggerthellaceae bacterium]|nr:ATP-binding protein [Eggerthellaceae bacterium]
MESIVVPAHNADPEPINDFVEEALSLHACPSKTLYQLQVAIEEIFVNIVSYAQLSEEDGIEIRCGVFDDPTRVVLQFLDKGIPFDPLTIEDPDISPDALMDREGGLGIFMVKQMMDEVSYVYENGTNILTIQKQL